MKSYLKLFFMTAMLFAFAACSDDSASASNSGEENLESSNDFEQESSSSAQSSSSWKELSSAVVIDISQFKNDDTTVVDSVNNAVYSTVVIGPYKWIKETIRIESDSVKSTCYDYDDDNCEKYGRLYYNRYSIGKVCPKGYSLASRGAYSYSAAKLELSTGGYCQKNDTLACKNLGTYGYYKTGDGYAFVIDSLGKNFFEDDSSNGFYYAKCVRPLGFVAKFNELPACESYNRYENVFVAEKDSSYECGSDSWHAVTGTSAKACSDTSARFWYADTMLVCTKNGWKVAGPTEIGEVCQPEIRYKQMEISGRTYVCENWYWTELVGLNKELGYCYQDIYGKLDTAKTGEVYACHGSSWEKPYINDIYGKCDSSNVGRVVTFDSVQQVCPSAQQGWRQLTDIEKEIGPCTDSSYHKVVLYEKDSTVRVCEKGTWKIGDYTWVFESCNTINRDMLDTLFGTPYKCQYSTWKRLSDLERQIGPCLNKNNGEQVTVSDTVFLCSGGQWAKKTSPGSSSSYAKSSSSSAVSSSSSIQTMLSVLGECNSARIGELVDNGLNKTKCTANGWEYPYGTLTDSRDNHVYRTTEIAGRSWMADNLKYNGSDVDESLCPGLAESNCESMGRLYKWHTVMKLPENIDYSQQQDSTLYLKAQGICPTGWHVPSYEEWKDLANAIDSTVGSYSNYNDYVGFPKMLSGYISETKVATGYLKDSNFRSSTIFLGASTTDHSYSMNSSARLHASSISRSASLSLRCIKD